MNLASPFIKRPVTTVLLGVGIAVAGIVGFMNLPVASLPNVDFPTISVQASLPGASPEIMATSVATPLERQLGRIAGITEMTSSSSLGSTRVVIQFDLSRNIDGAARDVQAAINAARGDLPADLPSNPSYRKVNPADAPIMLLSLSSPSYTRGQMYDFASSILQQKLSQVAGVGQVIIGGSSLPAVRVSLNPKALNHYGISLEQVRSVIKTSNVQQAKGQLIENERQSEIITNDRLVKAVDYAPIIVSYKNGAAIRIADLGQVTDSVSDLYNAGLTNGKPSVAVVIFKQPGANVIDTVDAIRKTLPLLKEAIPAGVDISVVMDRTTTIRASLRDVEITLLIAIVLVILVVYLFLGNVRAAFIPSVAVPLSLLGTFALMYVFGFSLDNLSLMALTIATGFVVDDAVLVLENIERHIEKGLSPMQAALVGTKEVGFTVLSMSFSLIAVFIPLLLMGGIVGRLFREFSLTLSLAILVSLVVSLTITPMMCSRLLRPKKNHNNNAHAHRFYEHSLAWALAHPRVVLFATLGALLLTIALGLIVPKGFLVQQDTGRLMASIQTQQDMSFRVMNEKLSSFIKIVQEDPAVDTVVGFIGSARAGSNSGSMFIMLKDLNERKISADAVLNRLRKNLSHISGAKLYMQAAQDLTIGGRQANSQFQYTVSADNLEDLNKWIPKLMEKFSTVPGIADVNSDQRDRGLKLVLNIDHAAASRFGITAAAIDTVLYDAFGQRQISVIYNTMNQYSVVLEAVSKANQKPVDLENIYVKSSNGEQIPLSVFANYKPSLSLLSVSHQGQFPSATLSFNILPGIALGDAVNHISQSLEEMQLPPNLYGTFRGSAQAFQSSLASQPYLILAALITVYIVLGILYESLIHPITILSTLPSAGVGALLALLVTGIDLSIIALIGVILLIGIVKKNAIMMIDFALQAERDHHKDPQEAIFEAALLRFRPIMMTTMAAILSAVPLVFASGMGSELRRPLGVTIIGGLFLSQVFTLYSTPVIYLKLETFKNYLSNKLKPAFVVATVVLSGCTVGPDYKVPVIEMPAQYKESVHFDDHDWKIAEPKDGEDRGDWWAVFEDPELDNLLKAVSISNQNLVAATAAVQQALALLSQAKASYFPMLTADASSSHGTSSSSSAVSTNYLGTLNASWELDLWGSVRRSVEAQKAAVQFSQAQLAGVKLSVQSLVAQNYFQLRTLDATQAYLDRLVRAYQILVKKTENKYRAGLVSNAAVLQAKSQLKASKIQAIDNSISRGQIEHAIAVLLSKVPASFSIKPKGFKASLVKIPKIPLQIPSALLERRPDIAAAERTVAQMNAELGVAIAGFFPNFSLSAADGLRANHFSTWITSPTHLWSLGSSLALSVLDGGLQSAKVSGARSNYDQSLANYRQTVLSALQVVEDDLLAVSHLKAEGLAQKDLLKNARESLKIVQNEYRSGTVSSMDVIIAQINLLSVQQATAELQGRQMISTLNLIKDLGGMW